MRTLLVSEIFGPTIQGEGAQIGRPTVFVRLAGCDYRCSWCDSMYAVDPTPENKANWKKMTATEIVVEVLRLSGGKPILITLSGGNPALQNCEDLLVVGNDHGCTFTMETQGSVPRPWFRGLDHLCISPKPPSSGMMVAFDKLKACIEVAPRDVIIKVVVFDRADFDWAVSLKHEFRHVRRMVPDEGIPFYLQVGNTNPRQDQRADVMQMLDDLEQLTNLCMEYQLYDVRVLPQLHALLWGNKRAV